MSTGTARLPRTESGRDVLAVVRTRPVFAFTVLAYVISWLFFYLPSLLGIDMKGPVAFRLQAIGIFGPAIAALVVAAIHDRTPTGIPGRSRWPVFAGAAVFFAAFSWLTRETWFGAGDPAVSYVLAGVEILIWAGIIAGVLGGRRGVRAVMHSLAERPSWVWLVVVLAAPVAVALAGLAITRALGNDVQPFLRTGSWQTILGGVVTVFIATFISGGGNEEPGWRGFAMPHLQARYSPLVASLIVGVVIGLWPLPAALHRLLRRQHRVCEQRHGAALPDYYEHGPRYRADIPVQPSSRRSASGHAVPRQREHDRRLY